MELIVAVSGTITKSNFDDFKAMAEERIKSLNFEPVTDEEFGQAEADVKGLAKFEKDLGTAEQDVLKQMDEVYQLVSGIGELKKLSAESRLKLKKQIDSQKKIVRAQIKRSALSTIPVAHPQAEARIEAAMKGKRTLDSLRAAADTEAETIAAEIERVRLIVDDYRAEHEDILHDEHKLLVMDCQVADAELARRVERKAAMLREAELRAEAERARKEAEAQRRAEAERVRKEAEAQRQAEAERLEAERKATPQPAPTQPVHTEDQTEPKPHWATKTEEQPQPEPTRDVSCFDGPAEEFARYLDTLRQCLAPLRQAREGLKHPENIERVGKFASTLNQAFAELKGGKQ
jgi:hypothetical protein